MTLRFASIAEEEPAEALEYYRGVDPRQDLRFQNEGEASLARISEHPEAWVRMSPQTRRCRINHFPFGLCYQVRRKRLSSWQ